MRRLLGAVAAAGLVLGCSGGSDDEAASEDTTTTAEAETSTTAEETTTTEAEPTTTAAPTTTTTPGGVVGQSQQTPLGNSATVYELQVPAVPNRQMALEADPGFIFAAVDFEFCAAPTFSDPGPLFESDIKLRAADNRIYEHWNVQDFAVQPRWPGDSTPAGTCQRGWITYQVPADVPITEVRWDTSGGTGSGPFLVWMSA